MSISNVSPWPAVWSDEELAEQAQKSLDAFVDRRLQEPRDRYLLHLAQRRAAIFRLFKMLSDVDPQSPDPDMVRTIMFDPALLGALRYVAGPPVSEDDLGVLVTRSTARLTKNRLKQDDLLAASVLRLICGMADPLRFPWIDRRTKPTPHELKQAVRATTALHAAQTMQTERRGYGRAVERVLQAKLIELGYEAVTGPPGNRISAPAGWPVARTFYNECTLYERKADLLIGLTSGRIVAVEAKDSSSAINSIKRVLNDTAAKAKHWSNKAGEGVVPVALLSGVFSIRNLKSAQASGLYLVWTHELDSFIDWLSAQ